MSAQTAQLQSRPEAANDHPEGFDRLVAENLSLLQATARSLTRNESDARDLVQDTLERALRLYPSFRVGSNGRAWLLTILHNRFIDLCRQASQRAPRVEAESVAETLVRPPEEPPRAWEEISLDQVRSALGQLEGEFRAIFELYEFEGASYRQIADRLGIPANTVGTRLLRARRKLRDLLLATLRPGESG